MLESILRLPSEVSGRARRSPIAVLAVRLAHAVHQEQRGEQKQPHGREHREP